MGSPTLLPATLDVMNMTFPERYAHTTSPPIDSRHGALASEESVTLWLWRWPRLLGWPHRINWLFSPVTGRDRHPGDLWGVDSQGRVIIVETKIQRGSGGKDPFEDFIGFAQRARHSAQPLSVDALLHRWNRLLLRERRFLKDFGDDRGSGKWLRGTHSGVVPYSSHREVIWQWPDLYFGVIGSLLNSESYERAVRRSLKCARGCSDPPLFVGLVASPLRSSRLLSARGVRHLQTLQSEVGVKSTVVRGITASQGRTTIRLRAWTPLAGEA
jgi:hypothetical protein